MPIQIHIKSSNSLDLLADDLISSIHDRYRMTFPGMTGIGIFTPIYIVTQTDGMKSWLKIRIAERTGVAANLVFLKPNELINKIYATAGGRYENILSPSDIQWLIYKVLLQPDFRNRYPSVASYYMKDGLSDDVKRIAFANKLADLFDQYQIYRPRMLEEWKAGRLTLPRAPEEQWQKDIWNLARENATINFPDRGQIKKTITDNLSHPENAEMLRHRIPEVFFFGTSLITDFHLEILIAASQCIPIHFYLPNPAPHIYWYEDTSRKEMFYRRRRGIPVDESAVSNPLLLNWGKLIRDTVRSFFQYDEIINQYEELPDKPEGTSLLAGVQRMVHKNTVAVVEATEVDDETKFTAGQLKDQSIAIRSCYSVVREVETLYNYLVKLIDEHPGRYSPRDIVVHVTDINKYSSYIRSVFNNAPYKLKYTIADESYTEADTISQALYEVLVLDEKNFTAENVVQLLNYSSIKNHFKITDGEVIRKVLTEANIRYGIEGQISNESVYVSWANGLRRIMYGICISSNEEYNPGVNGFYPLDDIEGSDANEAIRFVYMVRELISFLKEREGVKTVSEWVGYIHKLLNRLIFDGEEKDNEEYRLLKEHINGLAVDEELFREQISFRVFLKQFLPGLSEIAKNYRFARGGITFCSLIPMRSIPFRVVAMLGLDFDKFPRKQIFSGFDLMHKNPKLGDRNIRVNDKHLFLETLMSAGERLYLSYTGRDIKTNSELPPSILVEELISFIASNSEKPEQVNSYLMQEEPLHRFSSKYGNKEGYFNYLLTSGGKVRIGEREVDVQIENKEIDLRRIYDFLSDGLAWYYKTQIGIYYDDDAVALPETEIFELDTLERWNLKNDLLAEKKEQLADFIEKNKKLGNLPLKSAGNYEVSATLEEIELIKQLFDEEAAGVQPAELSLSVAVDDYTINAQINFVFGNKILVPCFSKKPQKYYARAWLYSLMLSAAEIDKQVVFIGGEKSTAEAIPMADAKQEIREILALMEESKQTIPVFTIDWFEFKKFGKITIKNLKKAISDRAFPQGRRDPDKYALLFMNEKLPGSLSPEDEDSALTTMLEIYKHIGDTVIYNIQSTFNC